MQEPGDNIVQSEKQVGDEALKLIRRYETLLNRHDKILGEVHATIIAFGRKLQVGLDMYGPGREFGQWIERAWGSYYIKSQVQMMRELCDSGPVP